MKLGTVIAALTFCSSCADAAGTRKLRKDAKGAKGCDLTGMYDIIETATYEEWGIPATDTAKMSFICFDTEDEFDDFGCLLFDECDVRRRLRASVDNSKRPGRGLHPHDPVQFCWFEAIGFPDLRRDLKESAEEPTALDANRKLEPGVHNAGLAVVYEEEFPFPNGKDKDLCYFEAYDVMTVPTMGILIRDGVLAVRTYAETFFPYFAHRTTK